MNTGGTKTCEVNYDPAISERYGLWIAPNGKVIFCEGQFHYKALMKRFGIVRNGDCRISPADAYNRGWIRVLVPSRGTDGTIWRLGGFDLNSQKITQKAAETAFRVLDGHFADLTKVEVTFQPDGVVAVYSHRQFKSKIQNFLEKNLLQTA